MNTKTKTLCQRIMLKFSGEALMGNKECGIDSAVIKHIVTEIKPVVELGIEVGIIIGGGNFFRGANLFKNGIDRITGDYMGMLGTALNALAMRDIFEKEGVPTNIMSALPIGGIMEGYNRNDANNYLRNKRVLLLAGGTGNPLVTTDSALGLRGIELKADLLLKATNVDGIYSENPQKNPKAKFYNHLTYKEALAQELEVMDLAAFCLCRDHKMRLRVFNMHKVGALLNVVLGKDEGTLVEV
jgi:uridylate kinase